MDHIEIENWIPYKLATSAGQSQCHWLHTVGKQFTEPFFDETILKCRSANNRYYEFSSVSALEMTVSWAGGLKEVVPAAFIFHISRCGSTLVSQLLSTMEQNTVLSEVPFFDDILRLPFKEPNFTEAEINNLLVSAFKYYARETAGAVTLQKKDLFIKADSWHIFFYRQLRLLYPGVPFILLYRRPDEVFRSHSKLPGMQAVPGMIEPQLFGFKPEEIGHDSSIYLANVLTSYLQKYLEIAANDERCMLINYNEGPMEMIKRVASFSNITISAQALELMEQRSHYHSKKPGEHFRKEAMADIPAHLEKAMELYYILDKKRMAML
ncbi:sulfotransferase family protein [Mucilaginibacter xinganensis]|uniref:Sulfotransferase family protein n=1 Tax=Mucilaginibacter xinganensis TaxID=1234841 RepID=A0A223NXG4_9SPHI|nr:hypothetical protein [Mucilaginibacter xinganensis]ASU34278.1 hypothetical protein MuYL_2391 [Mucilaginibacter xinganensis]